MVRDEFGPHARDMVRTSVGVRILRDTSPRGATMPGGCAGERNGVGGAAAKWTGAEGLRRGLAAQSRCHVHQLGERAGFHLSHHVTSVCLHGDFADAELATYLFV